jgi:hypothetical protein
VTITPAIENRSDATGGGDVVVEPSDPRIDAV